MRRGFSRVNSRFPSAIGVCRTENTDTYRQSDPEAKSGATDAFQAADIQHSRPRGIDQHQLPRYAWYVVVSLFLVNTFSYMDRMAMAVLAPSIKADLQLSDAQLGLLTGLAFGLFYVICGVPIARWADRGNRRNIIALALATWSVMTALSGAAQHFWQLFLLRMGVGAAEAGGIQPGNSLACDYVPPQRRGGMLSINAFGCYVGMVLGMALAGHLGDIIGWRWTFVVIGLPGIAFAAVFWLTVQEPVRGRLDVMKDDMAGASLGGTLAILWRSNTYRLFLLLSVLTGFAQVGFHQWLPSFYARTLGFSLSAVGSYVGLALGLGSGIGLLIGGVLANKLSRYDVALPLRICAVAMSFTLLTTFAALFVPSAAVSLLLLFVTFILWGLPGGSLAASLMNVAMPRIRATAGSILSLISAFGFGVGPFCIGLLSDILTPSLGAEALRYALLAPVSLLPVIAIILYAMGKSLRSELRAEVP